MPILTGLSLNGFQTGVLALSLYSAAFYSEIFRAGFQSIEKGQIEEALYEFGAEIESNTVEVYVSRLRKKVGKERIRTIRGIGYLLEEK
ncbi:MAG: winged helix-turn-helix domain-containing protein [Rhizobiales bacterium]|nr:winged helix-turn-helix domain-containing protein [Hyphomicrobiales bacterium]